MTISARCFGGSLTPLPCRCGARVRAGSGRLESSWAMPQGATCDFIGLPSYVSRRGKMASRKGPYSEDLRQRVVAAVDEGMAVGEAPSCSRSKNQLFGGSDSVGE